MRYYLNAQLMKFFKINMIKIDKEINLDARNETTKL